MPDRSMFIPSGFDYKIGDPIRDTNGRIGIVIAVYDKYNIVVRWPMTLSEQGK